MTKFTSEEKQTIRRFVDALESIEIRLLGLSLDECFETLEDPIAAGCKKYGLDQATYMAYLDWKSKGFPCMRISVRTQNQCNGKVLQRKPSEFVAQQMICRHHWKLERFPDRILNTWSSYPHRD